MIDIWLQKLYAKKHSIEDMHKKGQVGGLSNFAMGIVYLAIVVAIGLLILSKVAATLDVGSAARNAIDEIVAALAEIPGWVSILIVVVIGGIVLFVMQRAYSNKNQ